MKAKKISLAGDALNELFRYEPETGRLFRLMKTGRRGNIGEEAGCLKSNGYRTVSIFGRPYQVHRIIWMMVHGEIRDDLEIDHRDGVKDNNRIDNLRLVTGQQNQWNHTKAKGYSWDRATAKWQARIKVDRQDIHLGLFDKEEDARNAYVKAKKTFHQIDGHTL